MTLESLYDRPFDVAVSALRRGRCIQRWAQVPFGTHYTLAPDGDLMLVGAEGAAVEVFNGEDIAATDWRVLPAEAPASWRSEAFTLTGIELHRLLRRYGREALAHAGIERPNPAQMSEAAEEGAASPDRVCRRDADAAARWGRTDAAMKAHGAVGSISFAKTFVTSLALNTRTDVEAVEGRTEVVLRRRVPVEHDCVLSSIPEGSIGTIEGPMPKGSVIVGVTFATHSERVFGVPSDYLSPLEPADNAERWG